MSNTSEVSNHSDEISNSELVRKSQLGDKAAFEQLVIRHQDLVFSLAYKLTGNREMANVNIKFNNKDYLLSCDDGQEAVSYTHLTLPTMMSV